MILTMHGGGPRPTQTVGEQESTPDVSLSETNTVSFILYQQSNGPNIDVSQRTCPICTRTSVDPIS